jgi:hypothetical protein
VGALLLLLLLSTLKLRYGYAACWRSVHVQMRPVSDHVQVDVRHHSSNTCVVPSSASAYLPARDSLTDAAAAAVAGTAGCGTAWVVEQRRITLHMQQQQHPTAAYTTTAQQLCQLTNCLDSQQRLLQLLPVLLLLLLHQPTDNIQLTRKQLIRPPMA